MDALALPIVYKILLSYLDSLELGDISTSSQYVSFLIGIYAYLKLDMHKYLKIFFLVVTVGTIAEIVNTLTRLNGLPNGLSMNLYTFLNCLIFIFLFSKTKTISIRWFYSILCLFIVGSGFFTCINENINHLDTYLVVFTNFILMFLSSLSLIKMTNGDVDHLFYQPLFWISTSLLMFSTATNIVYSLFPASLYNSDITFYNLIWDVQGVLNIIYNLLFAYVFICHLRNPSYTQ